MATTTDFKLWTNFIDLENYEEIYCIYRSVSDIDEWGAFKCVKKETTKNNMYFLKCDYCDDTLVLASDKAKEGFLQYIQINYMKNNTDVEGWYGYENAMAKND